MLLVYIVNDIFAFSWSHGLFHPAIYKVSPITIVISKLTIFQPIDPFPCIFWPLAPQLLCMPVLLLFFNSSGRGQTNDSFYGHALLIGSYKFLGHPNCKHNCLSTYKWIQNRLPAFTIPFVVTSWAFLLFSTGNGVVTRSHFFINLVNLLPPLLISVTTIIFFTKSRSANPLTPEQRIMAMREKSQMALAQIVKLTAGGSCNFFKPTVVQINWTVNSLTFPKVWQLGWREWVL